MTTREPPIIVTCGSTDPGSPLVVLLHGRGSDERAIIGLADLLPRGATYAAVRAPIAEGGDLAGSPTAASAARSPRGSTRRSPGSAAGWKRSRPPGGPSSSSLQRRRGRRGWIAARRPGRFAGTAILYGTMPIEAGLDTGPGRLVGARRPAPVLPDYDGGRLLLGGTLSDGFHAGGEPALELGWLAVLIAWRSCGCCGAGSAPDDGRRITSRPHDGVMKPTVTGL